MLNSTTNKFNAFSIGRQTGKSALYLYDYLYSNYSAYSSPITFKKNIENLYYYEYNNQDFVLSKKFYNLSNKKRIAEIKRVCKTPIEAFYTLMNNNKKLSKYQKKLLLASILKDVDIASKLILSDYNLKNNLSKNDLIKVARVLAVNPEIAYKFLNYFKDDETKIILFECCLQDFNICKSLLNDYYLKQNLKEQIFNKHGVELIEESIINNENNIIYYVDCFKYFIKPMYLIRLIIYASENNNIELFKKLYILKIFLKMLLKK